MGSRDLVGCDNTTDMICVALPVERGVRACQDDSESDDNEADRLHSHARAGRR
jgi:hypothetical protein